MKPQTNPPRLRDTEEYGAVMGLLEEEAPSPERVARNGAVVKQRLAGLAAAGHAAAGLSSATAIKIGLPLLLMTGGVGGYFALRTPATTPAAKEPRRPRVAPAPSEGTSRRGAPAERPAEPSSTPSPGRDDTVEPAAPHREARPRTRPKSVAVAARPRAGAARPEVERPAVPVTETPRPSVARSSPSSLPEQMRLFQAARRAARAKRWTAAEGHLAELLRRYPDSVLRAEAELSEAECLVGLGRRRQAADLVLRLLADPLHAGRRGELWRLEGDLRRQLGDCAGALAAYRSALHEPLSDREKGNVRVGIESCSAGSKKN